MCTMRVQSALLPLWTEITNNDMDSALQKTEVSSTEKRERRVHFPRKKGKYAKEILTSAKKTKRLPQKGGH